MTKDEYMAARKAAKVLYARSELGREVVIVPNDSTILPVPDGAFAQAWVWVDASEIKQALKVRRKR